MAAYAATVTKLTPKGVKLGGGLGVLAGEVNLSNYNQTLAEITDITSHFRTKAPVVVADAISSNGYAVEWDTSAKAFKAYDTASAVAFTGSAPVPSTIEVTDDDSAASNGTALYVHIDELIEQGSYLGHLESVTANNGDSTFQANDGGPSFKVQDDDSAASGGVALYFDEDGTEGARFLANTGHTVYIMGSNGEFLTVTHNATPGTPGVQVYFDDNGSNAYERLLFVSPTNMDGSDVANASVGMVRDVPAGTLTAGVASEAASDVDVGSFNFFAVGIMR